MTSEREEFWVNILGWVFLVGSVVTVRYLELFWLTAVCAGIVLSLLAFIALIPVTLVLLVGMLLAESQLSSRYTEPRHAASPFIAFAVHFALTLVVSFMAIVDVVFSQLHGELTMFLASVGSIPFFFAVVLAILFLIGQLGKLFFRQAEETPQD